MKKLSRKIFRLCIIILGITGLVLYIFIEKNNNITVQKVRINKDKEQISVSNDGVIRITDDKGTFTFLNEMLSKSIIDIVLSEKPSFEQNKYSVEIIYSQGGSDIRNISSNELENILDEISDISPENDASEDTNEEDEGIDQDQSDSKYSEIFPTPTPRISGLIPSPSSVVPTDDCPFWRISYCVYPWPTATPVIQLPTITPIQYPNLVFDCSLGEAKMTKRTVISNTLCVASQ